MKILLTAFEPFNNHKTNYSEVVLNKIINNKKLIKVVLPVEYYSSFILLKEIINKEEPTIIILLGEARSYSLLAFEVIAINEFGNKADNSGFIPETNKIIEKGPDGIFATLNYQLFEETFNKTKTKFKRSYSAGTYVCNSLMYQTLNYLKAANKTTECGFIHLPDLNKQSLSEIVNGLNEYILSLIDNN